MKTIETQADLDKLGDAISDHVVIIGNVTLRWRLEIRDGGWLDIPYGGWLEIRGGGRLDVRGDGQFDVFDGGWLDIQDGGRLTISGIDVPELNAENMRAIAPLALAEGALEMERIHTCKTTHCIAGWACHALPGGKKLEKSIGWYAAGMAMLGTDAAFHFYDSDEDARKWLGKFVGDEVAK